MKTAWSLKELRTKTLIHRRGVMLMRYPCVPTLLVCSFAMSISMRAQSIPPQTARQALIELLFGGGGEAFSRHLPELARTALQNTDGIYSEIVRMSGTSRPILGLDGNFEISDSGPVIAARTFESGYRIEIDLERDVTNGETDEIELSSHVYSNNEELNQPHRSPATSAETPIAAPSGVVDLQIRAACTSRTS